MAGERRARILALLLEHGPRRRGTKRLCEVGAEVTSMTGAGIMLMFDDLPKGSVCSSDEVSALIERLQFDLGEGPCIDAHHHDRPVLEPDLAEPSRFRWQAFVPPAIAAGARAVFGFPLRIGAVRLGALNLYADEPGALSDDQHADALSMSGVAAEMVMLMQAGATAGQLADELDVGGDFRSVVHQASGMVAVQLEISVGQALVRLRAHAFGEGRALNGVAEDVVARRLRFDGGLS